MDKAIRDNRRWIDREEKRLTEEFNQMQKVSRALSAAMNLFHEVDQLRKDNEALREENERLKRQLQEKEDHPSI
ncbi:MAG: hypothetical protein K6F89_00130 [Prevotella sp.]|nr:hypothetical protein [Prevotella sp.]